MIAIISSEVATGRSMNRRDGFIEQELGADGGCEKWKVKSEKSTWCPRRSSVKSLASRAKDEARGGPPTFHLSLPSPLLAPSSHPPDVSLARCCSKGPGDVLAGNRLVRRTVDAVCREHHLQAPYQLVAALSRRRTIGRRHRSQPSHLGRAPKGSRFVAHQWVRI